VKIWFQNRRTKHKREQICRPTEDDDSIGTCPQPLGLSDEELALINEALETAKNQRNNVGLALQAPETTENLTGLHNLQSQHAISRPHVLHSQCQRLPQPKQQQQPLAILSLPNANEVSSLGQRDLTTVKAYSQIGPQSSIPTKDVLETVTPCQSMNGIFSAEPICELDASIIVEKSTELRSYISRPIPKTLGELGKEPNISSSSPRSETGPKLPTSPTLLQGFQHPELPLNTEWGMEKARFSQAPSKCPPSRPPHSNYLQDETDWLGLVDSSPGLPWSAWIPESQPPVAAYTVDQTDLSGYCCPQAIRSSLSREKMIQMDSCQTDLTRRFQRPSLKVEPSVSVALGASCLFHPSAIPSPTFQSTAQLLAFQSSILSRIFSNF
ncbi:unnamed protein product, partial [Protopolystoma xenopodis]